MSILIRSNDKLAPWNPFRELDEVSNRLSRLFAGNATHPSNGQEEITVAEWAPLVDIIEDDNEFLIKAELPEVKKENVKVRVEDGVLSISGERAFEKVEKSKRYHRVERAYGTFTRNFTLPEEADPQQVKAEFTEGVLKVHVAKSKDARPKSIEIKVN